jgi:hypothetical protein
VWHFIINFLYLRRGGLSPSPKTEAGGSPLVGSPWLLTQYVRSCSVYVEAVSSIRDQRTRHANMASQFYSKIIWKIKIQFFSDMQVEINQNRIYNVDLSVYFTDIIRYSVIPFISQQMFRLTASQHLRMAVSSMNSHNLLKIDVTWFHQDSCVEFDCFSLLPSLRHLSAGKVIMTSNMSLYHSLLDIWILHFLPDFSSFILFWQPFASIACSWFLLVITNSTYLEFSSS